MRADVNALSWRTSSYSNGDGGSCVEVARELLPALVPVRDTKQSGAGPVLTFAAAAWASFVQGVKAKA
ncbi:DUF397 domain-containing protein [Streptomyces sp. NRRL F-4428]|uniref:DUF397 domain-containing protein n=1 Tax=Streptomyces sp. NRRL F-4428 TaxID=1609137 RepID=UPI0005ECF4C1|nr:DUF397 domain-containing protein [Streptomyces sp. NRRL F-4428]KJK44172.1 hypothetical protein UK14_29005 [Streptomyces sp. NRRL F-4428]